MIIIPSILALSITSAPTSIPLSSQSPTREPIAIDPAADIQFVGPQDQPILILPLQTPQWAKDLGIIKTRRLYKGICADHGAVINPQDLLDAAEADLNDWRFARAWLLNQLATPQHPHNGSMT